MKIDLKNFRKIDGLSCEEIVIELTEADIKVKYGSRYKAVRYDEYIKHQLLEVADNIIVEVTDILGTPDRTAKDGNLIYFAEYRPNDYPIFKNYSGRLMFRSGKLLERTEIITKQ